MINTELDYIYKTAHYPNTVSWYRELVYLGDELVGEICNRQNPRRELRSTMYANIYRYKLLMAL